MSDLSKMSVDELESDAKGLAGWDNDTSRAASGELARRLRAETARCAELQAEVDKWHKAFKMPSETTEKAIGRVMEIVQRVCRSTALQAEHRRLRDVLLDIDRFVEFKATVTNYAGETWRTQILQFVRKAGDAAALADAPAPEPEPSAPQPAAPPDDALLPCPFCGNTPAQESDIETHHVSDDDDFQFVRCRVCGSCGPVEGATNRWAWNKRVAPPPAGQDDKLRRALRDMLQLWDDNHPEDPCGCVGASDDCKYPPTCVLCVARDLLASPSPEPALKQTGFGGQWVWVPRPGERIEFCKECGCAKPPSQEHDHRQEPAAAWSFTEHLRKQAAWSLETFGPGPRVAGVIDHIREELREIEADPTDLVEWIDVLILACDGAWRSGATPEQIVECLRAKMAKNMQREWPDWRTQPPDKRIKAIKPEPAAATQRVRACVFRYGSRTLVYGRSDADDERIVNGARSLAAPMAPGTPETVDWIVADLPVREPQTVQARVEERP